MRKQTTFLLLGGGLLAWWAAKKASANVAVDPGAVSANVAGADASSTGTGAKGGLDLSSFFDSTASALSQVGTLPQSSERVPTTQLVISDYGLDLIAHFEGFQDAPYADAGHQAIGYGHQILPGEHFDVPMTEEGARALLVKDTDKATQVIRQRVKVPLSQNEFDALVSFVYNVGSGAFIDSTLLTLLNQGDYQGAANEFLHWDKTRIGGKLQSTIALATRRQTEAELFLA